MAVVTKTLRASGGSYSLMSLWESTEQTNLVTDGDTHVLECAAFSETVTTSMTVQGWTSDADNFITIKAEAGAEHGGIIGAGYVRTVTIAGGQAGLSVAQSYTVVQDLEFIHLDGGAINANNNTGPTNIQFKRLIAQAEYTAIGVYSSDIATESCTVENCLAHSSKIGILVLANTAAFGTALAPVILNNTIVGCSLSGIQCTNLDTTAVFKNNVMYNPSVTDADFYIGLAGNGAPSGSNNASLDTSVSTNSIGTVTGVADSDFAAYGSGDYKAATGGALDGAGTQLSWLYVDDIAGDLRTDFARLVNTDQITFVNGDLATLTDTG
jgi:hypothetical protein